MKKQHFFINSGKLIINDPVQIFNDNNHFVLDNVLDGCYVVRFDYNNDRLITFIEIVNVDFEFYDLVPMFTDDVYSVFCFSTMLGIFDSNFYLENTNNQESANKFYDLCCHVTSSSDGCDIIDNACFVCDCSIDDYKIRTAVYDGKIIGLKVYKTKENFQKLS